jgi:predicted nucleotidyltransferase
VNEMSAFIETAIHRARMIREWRVWVERLAETAREIIGELVKVYVIGSIVRGDYTGGSDVDVLIVSPRIPSKPIEKARIKVLIEDKLKLPYYHPFEIHLLKPEEASLYLSKAGKYLIRII